MKDDHLVQVISLSIPWTSQQHCFSFNLSNNHHWSKQIFLKSNFFLHSDIFFHSLFCSYCIFLFYNCLLSHPSFSSSALVQDCSFWLSINSIWFHLCSVSILIFILIIIKPRNLHLYWLSLLMHFVYFSHLLYCCSVEWPCKQTKVKLNKS